MDKRLTVFLCTVFFLPSLYVNFTAGWNVESRWALSEAITRKGYTHIEEYITYSRDVTEIDGHLYSAKAPGLSLLCVPILWSLDRIYPVYTIRAETVKRFICRIITVGLPLVGIGYIIWSFNSPLAPLVAVSTVLGTPLLPYASVLYGHVLAAFLLFTAWRLLNNSSRGALISGLFSGMSVLVEYPAIFGVIVLGGMCLYRSYRNIGRFIIGGIPAVLVLVVYNYVSFGTFFATGYSSFSDPEFQAVVDTGFFGFGMPSVTTMISMLFSPYRGLFFTAPWLLLWFPAIIGNTESDIDRFVSVVVPSLYVLIFSGFTMWWGGASCCMRHLLIMIPFMVFPVVFLRNRISYVVPLMVSGIGSTLVQLSFLMVEPETPENFAIPLFDQVVPWLFGSRIRPMVIDIVEMSSAFRIGIVMVVAFLGWYCAVNDFKRRRVVSGEAL